MKPKQHENGNLNAEFAENPQDRPTDGLIWKQDAIDAIHCNITVTGRQNAELVAATIGAFADRIKALPPVQPKRGKWVFKTVFPNDTSEFPMGYLVCSECGSKHSNKTPCNFCDNCGADMRCSENPNS